MCLFDVADGLATCIRCERSVPTSQTDGVNVHRACILAEIPCMHRGGWLRDEGCKVGCASRAVPVYMCVRRGECSASRISSKQTIPLCTTCDQREV